MSKRTKKIKPLLLIFEFLTFITAIVFVIFVGTNIEPETALVLPQVSVWIFLFYFFIVTALLIFLLRYMDRGHVMRVLFALALFIGAQEFFKLFFTPFLSTSLAAITVLAHAYFHSVLVHNLTVIVGVAGIVGTIGLSIPPTGAIMILVILALYDIIAVYSTKHMVKMATQLFKLHIILAFVIPETLSGFQTDLDQTKNNENFFIVGIGDIALPMLLVISSLALSLAHAIIVGLFMVFGALVVHLLFVSQKKPLPIPALPPMALFTIFGFLLAITFL